MIETNDDHSPSIVFYYNKKNDDNVEEILEKCHFGNQLSSPYINDVTSIDLSLYMSGEGDSSIQF